MILLRPMNIGRAAADLAYSPIWKKFPDVPIALSEGGIGWIPYFLERLDHTVRTHNAWTGVDFGSHAPNEFFLHPVMRCFITDPVGLKRARCHIGVHQPTLQN